MNNTIINKVITKIRKARRGTLYFPDSFINIGNKKAVSKSLQRLVESGEIIKIAAGIYVRPEKDPVLGIVKPGIDKIAEAIARRDKSLIVPTGEYAKYKLGLSKHIPMNYVYLTTGSSRKINLDNNIIIFKKTGARNISAVGTVSRLAIQALRSIGEKNVEENEIKQIVELLKSENKNHLMHDLRFAPEWIREILRTALNKTNA